jgi:hypothetical protein
VKARKTRRALRKVDMIFCNSSSGSRDLKSAHFAVLRDGTDLFRAEIIPARAEKE